MIAAQTDRNLDVHENALRKWVREAAADPQKAFPGKGVMKPHKALRLRGTTSSTGSSSAGNRVNRWAAGRLPGAWRMAWASRAA